MSVFHKGHWGNQKMLFITSVERIGMEKGRLIGIQIGEQRGRLEGRQEGEAKMLTRQLQRRFGVVPDWVNEMIAKADLSSLEEWGVRLLDAKFLEDVFVE
ncbi:MAG: DUF4351 domain-containing protein [Magnetococcus sp. YQC-9]